MSKLYPTPHINGVPSDFAPTVIMPGDPLRARYIAENFLQSPTLINNVRGIQGYTGLYQSVPVTVMASGMGMPSMAIYSQELFQIFGVKNIIRVGTCGGIVPQANLRDLVLAQGCCTDSNYGEKFGLPGTFAPIADFDLLSKAHQLATAMAYPHHVGNLVSSDRFYYDDDHLPTEQKTVQQWLKMGVLAAEMEGAALYMNAARYGGKALVICTVSDHMVTGESLDANARETSFTHMMKLALELARIL